MTVSPRRNFPHLVAAFKDAIVDSPIPERFRVWSAISAIAGAMGRRCWYDFGAFRVYPNMFISLVAGPGRGKSVSMALPFGQVYKKLSEPIGSLERDWSGTYAEYGLEKPLWIIQDRITPEKLTQDMKSCQREVEALCTMDTTVMEAPVTLVTSEFGAFMNRNDHYLQMFMTDMWDSKDEYSYRTKTSGVDRIEGPCINWLVGATPDQFVENLPNNARSQGLLSRLIIVYWTGAELKRDLHYQAADAAYIHRLVQDLSEVARLCGEFKFADQEAYEAARGWVQGGMEPMPLDPNMREYCERRLSHLMKVAMVVSASKRNDRLITLEDWEEAKSLLLDVEQDMPRALERFGVSESGRLMLDLAEVVRELGDQRLPLADFSKLVLRAAKNASDVESIIKVMSDAKLIKVDGLTVWRVP